MPLIEIWQEIILSTNLPFCLFKGQLIFKSYFAFFKSSKKPKNLRNFALASKKKSNKKRHLIPLDIWRISLWLPYNAFLIWPFRIFCWFFERFQDTKRTFRNQLTFRNAWIRRCTKNPDRMITNAKIEKNDFDQRQNSSSCLGTNSIYFGHSILFQIMLSTVLMLQPYKYLPNSYLTS